MAVLNLNGSSFGNALQDLLSAQDIVPGDAPSYQTCKAILAYHPLGAKMADSPVWMAQSQKRLITVPKGPEDRLKEAFDREWAALDCDRFIFNAGRLSRAYGRATLALVSEGTPPDRPVDYKALSAATISFNVFDPLNTAGSMTFNQDPNSLQFQRTGPVVVNGQAYHPSRVVNILNEDPLYIEFTSSAFGYTGRSVFQRALFMLKSYIQTLITDDMVALKAGVLVAKAEQGGSIVDNAMAAITGQKRAYLKEAQVGNVLSIGLKDEIQSLDLANIGEPYKQARANIIENIATAADMPAIILNQETFAEGFGEGTEDAKRVVQFINRIRVWLEPLYNFCDKITQYRAWTLEFYKTLQTDFPETYGSVAYTQAFYDWRNSFNAAWPNLLEEPDSEKVKVADTKLKAMIAIVEILLPAIDPDNKATVIAWLADNLNEDKVMFTSPLLLDIDALKDYTPPTPLAADKEPSEPKPFAAADSTGRRLKLA